MDKLSAYIQNGESIKTKKLILSLFALCLIMGIIFYGMSYYISHTPENMELIKSIPEIQLKDGVITSPADTLWEKDISENGPHLRLNTKIETADTIDDNTILLTKTKVYFKFQGNMQAEDLPKQSVIINIQFLLNRLSIGLIQLSGIITFLLFISLLIGGYITYGLSSLIIRILHKEWDKEMIKKSSLIGWISIIILNIVLLLAGYGFSLMTGVFLATFISLFSLFQVNKKS